MGAHRSFIWQGMKWDIGIFVSGCDTCQHNKGELIKLPSQLQPLPIPNSLWTDISMDFIVILPKAGNKSVIMVTIDCLSNYAHFCAFPYSFTPSFVSQVFIDQIFKLHGMPTSFVSDHDPTFTSHLW